MFTDAGANGSVPQIYRYDLRAGRFHSAMIKDHETEPVSFCFPIKGEKGLFVAGITRSTYVIKWDGVSSYGYPIKNLGTVEQQYSTHIISKGYTDQKGRLYLGTWDVVAFCTSAPTCGIHSYNYYRHGFQTQDSGYTALSGIAWSPKGDRFYIMDVCGNCVVQYKCNPRTGKLCKLYKY